MSQSKLSHVDSKGNPRMVDVSEKKVSRRYARARALVKVSDEILAELHNNEISTKKGPVFQTAIIAGVQGAKRTSELIPFCHPLGLENCNINIKVEEGIIVIESEVTVEAKTGVEMEALTAATVCALTVYDMLKAMSHNILITDIMLLEKTGGKSDYKSSNV